MSFWLVFRASLSRLPGYRKNALGRAHGFACDTQGTLFFDVARIIDARRPAIFVLENVKNLKSHDGGKTFRIIMQTLDELGYDVADSQDMGADDPKIIDGKHFLPQHRERIVLVGFRRDLNLKGILPCGISRRCIRRVVRPWLICWSPPSMRNLS
jgi:DNA (cytosine-5)-methyltransferase 1